MRQRLLVCLCFLVELGLSLLPAAASKISFNQYHKPEEVRAWLKSLAAENPQLAQLLLLGKSSGGTEMIALRLAAQSKGSPAPDVRPAVFISANLEGVHVVGTEAALKLIEKLIAGYRSDKSITRLLDTKTIYVAPLLNPDGAQAFFSSPRLEKWTNSRAVDDDLDMRTDEDGPEDLNKDGLITQMRVKDPEGKWIPDPIEPRLMRLADPKKGEKGIYKLYAEGLDDDGDGEYNEDPPGGVVLNRNFPHDFEYDALQAGRWPVSEAETLALVEFLVAHRPIAMVLNFSTENTILNLQQTGQARAGADRVRVPRQFATFLGLEPDREYGLKEIVEAVKASGMGGGMEITEDMVASFLGLGPAVTIDRLDMPFLEAIQKEYKDALKEAKIEYPEKRAKGVGKGSLVAYCYYQYGVPVFSVDLWSVPEPKKEAAQDVLTAEKLKSMSTEDFLALGEDRIEAFLKAQGAPPNFNAGMLIQMVKSGQVTPARMAEMMEKMPRRSQAEGDEHPELYILKWSDEALKGKGFVSWSPFQHPALGEVEIGGFAPFIKINPPPDSMEKTLDFHADFFIRLMNKLPELRIEETKAETIGPELYQVTVFLTNGGWFPTSTAQGRRAQTAWPIRVSLKMEAGQSLFSGRPVETIPFLDGSGDTKKVEWTLKGKKGSRVTVTASSPKLGFLSSAIILD